MMRLTIIMCCFGLLTTGLQRESRAVEIVGHRGSSFSAPENTLASVNLAWKQNADAVEIDVYLSKDGRIVVIHDKTTKRYGGPNRKVSDQTFAELRKLDVGTWKNKKYAGEKIPTLKEVVATVPAGKRLFIEIKCGPEIVPVLKRDLKAAGKKPGQTAVISFSHAAVKAVKRELPQLKVYWVIGLKRSKVVGPWKPGVAEIIRKAKDANVDGIDLGAKPAITPDYVAKIKAARLEFYVWTVNSVREAERLRKAGVDGITTDRPGLLKEKLQ